ncbi:hypothetical protein RHOSPDRAFT_30475 [Rhodotorula sp. JG-1b]|nr:hypothetical protein RHOSPDRAFT_30475 [Rhodotorula sp. JG-1b]
MAMVPTRMPRSVQPATGLRLLTTSSPAARNYSSSSAGRSSSRDGTRKPDTAPTTAQKPASATTTTSSTTAAAADSAAAAVQPRSPLSTSTTQSKKRNSSSPTRQQQQVNERAFELPHVRKSLVGLDAFFATHRPLLELPLRLGARRSTVTDGGVSDSAYVPRDDDRVTFSGRHHSRNGDDLVQVVDQAEDGSAVGEPYLVRLSEPEPLRSVEEELAAEAVEEAELAQQEELQHELEATEDKPYEPWLLGQHNGTEDVNVARYLAVRPPFTAPAPSSAPAAPTTTSSPSKELDFIAPFLSTPSPSSSASSPSSAATATSSTDYSTTFSSHFVEPLSPNEATGAVDRFLSHHEVLYRWSAQTDFVNAAGEALRRAGRAYSPVSATTDVTSSSSSSSAVLDALRKQRGSVRLWTDADGFMSIPVGLHLDSLSSSPFLPAEDVIVEDIRMDSVKRKRQKKIRKHKHRKRRKAQRALRQKLGKQ